MRNAADYVMLALAVVLGGGSLVLFAWANRPVLVPLHLSPIPALAWDAFLSCIFFVQHSVMVRRPVRARLSAVIPARYDGAFYSITSGLALAAFAVFFQPVEQPRFAVHGVARALVQAVALFAAAGFVWSISVFRSFDPFGIRPIRRHLRGATDRPEAAAPFVVRGPYAWVRHPLYFFVIVLLWATPVVTPSGLLVAVLWTAWIAIGARLEERDLIADFGDEYLRYRRDVPFLVPWRWRSHHGRRVEVRS